MENSQLIMWGVYGPFLGWLALSNIQQGKKIIALQTLMTGLEYKIDTLTSSVDKLSSRLDLLLKSELDTLKDIAKSVGNR